MASSEIIENTTDPKAEKDAQISSASWLAEIKASEKWMSKWKESGRKITRRYLDRRDAQEENTNKINIFTTNTQILLATLYSKFPKPMVTREFEDQDDDVGRVAAEIVERCVKIRASDDFDTSIRNVVQDRLVPGAGNVWFRYDAVTEKVEIPAVILPDGTEEAPASVGEKIVSEKVFTDYVFWEDMLWSPSRTWEKVRWVGRIVQMTKKDVEARFGKKIAELLSYRLMSVATDATATPGEAPNDDAVDYAQVYEIWCKRTKSVYWVVKGIEFILDKKPDMLGLKKFFPCPKPLLAMHSTSNFMPRPDFLMVQDQYEELDMINERITKLERAIKAVGIYDGTNAEIERIFTEAIDNTIIPSKSFSEFMEKGGMKGAIDWIPIEMFVNALEKLRQYRQDLIAQIYELTGISDIMRGSSKASETLGAQQLKAQYGSVKLQFLQMEVATFVEEALNIKAEIVVGKFQPQSIVQESNIEKSKDPELIEPAIALLKSPDWQFRVEVHADSMAVPEFNAERDGRMMLLRAMAEMMTAAAPILEQSPEAGIGMLQVVQWAAASFRTGRTIEGVLDKAIQAMQKQAAQPKPAAPPDPVIEKAKIDAQTKKDLAVQDSQTKVAIANIEAANDSRIANMEAKMEQQTKLMVARIDQATADLKIASDQHSEAADRAAQAQTAAADREAEAANQEEEMDPQLAKVLTTVVESIQSQNEAITKMAQSVEKLAQPRRKIPVRDPKTRELLYADDVPMPTQGE